MHTNIKKQLERLTTLIRYWIVDMTTIAGSGHLTSSLSAVDVMTVLFFGGIFRYDTRNPDNPYNDRIVFSKGHATPLFYALWAAAGVLPAKELSTYRTFNGRLEGHPTRRFPFADAATGSLGQGLSVGVGMALAQKKLQCTAARTFVLLGDGEMAEGQVDEALRLAAKYRLGNLVAIVDANRLGQCGETMYGRDVRQYAARANVCGWRTVIVDGHNLEEVYRALTHLVYDDAAAPLMIVARTRKGKGISFVEDRHNRHGKALSPDEQARALAELGPVDFSARKAIALPRITSRRRRSRHVPTSPMASAWTYDASARYGSRDSYGAALVDVLRRDPRVVVLDADVGNSTYADAARLYAPERFFEMYIAEQNMVSLAVGLARLGYHPFVSTFAAFLTRAHDQIRMAAYSGATITFVGSHAGVATGADGVSQMGLEDIAMMRSVYGATVLQPADARATVACVKRACATAGITYIRTVREKTPLLPHTSLAHARDVSIVRDSIRPDAVICASGATVAQALEAAQALAQRDVEVCVIDITTIAPLNAEAILSAIGDCSRILIAEDHYRAGGVGEAVLALLATIGRTCATTHLAVDRLPRSGAASELFAYEKIDACAMMDAVAQLCSKHVTIVYDE